MQSLFSLGPSTTSTALAPRKMRKSKTSVRDLGLFGRFWGQFYHHFHLFGVKIHFSVAALLLFSILNVSCHKYLINQLNWPDVLDTSRAAGFCVGFFHTATLLPAVFEWAVLIGWPNLDITGQWKSLAERNCLSTIMRFSLGYFYYDTLYNLIFVRFILYNQMTKAEWLFLAHHVITIVNLSIALSQPKGEQYQFYTWCMLFAEVTNPLDNVMAFTNKGMELSPGPFLEVLNYHVETVLSVVYLLNRGFILPLALGPYTTYGLWVGRDGKRIFNSILGGVSMWIIILGGIPWVLHCYKVVAERMVGEVSVDKDL